MNIRTLNADEIECRIQQITEKGCSLLLYKDARVDMKLLDEIFGFMNWQRSHEQINGQLFCNIDIWDENKKCWIRKQDVGTESNSDAEKGRASDSFKRAGFNIGIGRELYTAPPIWISLSKEELISKGQKWSTYTKFEVKDIKYNDKKEIIDLTICDNKGKERYHFNKGKPQSPTNSNQKKMITRGLLNNKETMDLLCKWIYKNECEAKKNNKRFLMADLIEKNYKVTQIEVNTIAEIYEQYKINNNLS